MFLHCYYCFDAAKVVGKTERPSPLLEIFSTNLEKLLFVPTPAPPLQGRGAAARYSGGCRSPPIIGAILSLSGHDLVLKRTKSSLQVGGGVCILLVAATTTAAWVGLWRWLGIGLGLRLWFRLRLRRGRRSRCRVVLAAVVLALLAGGGRESLW